MPYADDEEVIETDIRKMKTVSFPNSMRFKNKDMKLAF